MTNHIISYDSCLDSIRGVCSRCGGPLKPIDTVDNMGRPTFWAGCESCYRFDNGVSEEVYRIASIMVNERSFNPYSFSTPIPDRIAGACNIVNEILYIKKNLNKWR